MKDFDKQREEHLKKIKVLREYTNCSISNAINAIKYAHTRPKCTACGYIRAIIGNTGNFSNEQFYKRVKDFSDLDNDIL